MKKITLFILFLVNLFNTNHLFAQLFVSDNSYIYNKGSLVYTKGNLELNGLNSNFYLRNEGQLLQGKTGSSENLGVGKLSVFQEGSVNNYAYNYWCSPVGNASSASGNENFGITMLNVPTTNVLSTPVSILAINNYDGVSGAGTLAIAPYWIWKFLSASIYSQWFHSGATSNIAAGEGFTMKGVSGSDATNTGELTPNNPGSNQRYDFRGKPNDGDITINVGNGMHTLTGNPYTSAIDLSAFLTDAVNSTGIAYFWEHDKTINTHLIVQRRGGYGTFSPISRGGTGVYVPAMFYSFDIGGNQLPLTATNPNNSYARYFSPIGQGFMIEGNGLGSTVTMKNSYRVFQKENILTSVFEKDSNLSNNLNTQYLPPIQSVSGFDYTTVSSAEVPQIRFNTMLNNLAIKQVVLAFDSSATDGVDHAKDAKNPSDSSLDMYFVLADKEYIISVIEFDETKRLPVGFKSNENGLMKITVAEMINFSQADNVFLFDNITGIYHDIKNFEYEFQINAGVTNNRYEITFKDTALSTALNNTINDVAIVQNNTTNLLLVSNPNNLDVKSVAFYDISGKLLFDKVNLGTKLTYEFSTASLSEGVYIVKLKTNDGQSVGQKIIVERIK